jgi:hypothetical protein
MASAVLTGTVKDICKWLLRFINSAQWGFLAQRSRGKTTFLPKVRKYSEHPVLHDIAPSTSLLTKHMFY